MARALDRNEARYVEQKWGELRGLNRIQVITAIAIGLGSLVGLVVIVTIGFGSSAMSAFGSLLGVLMMLAIVVAFGFIAIVRSRFWSVPTPDSPEAVVIEGTFWEETSRRRITRYGIGDTYVSVPPHWFRLLRRSSRSGAVLIAEVTDGPAETAILLSVNGVLSVSRDVPRGLLAVKGSLIPVAALLALVGLMVCGVFVSDPRAADLNLWRYLHGGSGVARFSSVAELRRAPPPAFARVQLAGVVFARADRGAVVAQDDPPAELADGKRLAGEAHRIAGEIAGNRCAAQTARCPGDEHERHADALAGAVTKLLADVQSWVARLDGAGRGLAVRGQHDPAPDLDEALEYLKDNRAELGTEGDRARRHRARVDELTAVALKMSPGVDSAIARDWARKDAARNEEKDLAPLRDGLDRTITDTVGAFSQRHDLEGIFYRRPSGEEWLEGGAAYSKRDLHWQAAALAFALVTVLLVGLSVVVFARAGRIIRKLARTLPPSL